MVASAQPVHSRVGGQLLEPVFLDNGLQLTTGPELGNTPVQYVDKVLAARVLLSKADGHNVLARLQAKAAYGPDFVP